MTIPGDEARASVAVRLPPAETFALFTEQIDLWWRRGLAYRVAGTRSGIIAIEPRVGGRLFERFDGDDGPAVQEMGRVTVWEPPARLAFEWRAVNFATGESTEVEVLFAPTKSGTLVSVIHRGWAAIRADHPARHGLAVPAFVRMMGLWWGDLLTSLRERADDSLLAGSGMLDGLPADLSRRFDHYLDKTFVAEKTAANKPRAPAPRTRVRRR